MATSRYSDAECLQLDAGRAGYSIPTIRAARDQFGFPIEKTVSARDKIRTNNRYEELWSSLEFLLRPNIVEIATLQQIINQREMSKKLNISIKAVERIDRALVYLKLIPPTISGSTLVEEQDAFINKVLELRKMNMGNYKIAELLGVSVNKVETVARFLVWLGLVKPISKSDALRTRWKRELYKQQVREFLATLNPADKVSVRKIHVKSGIEIGYDMFLSLYRELSKEQVVPRARLARD